METNKQIPVPNDRCEDGTLVVHSIFNTIQGEGPYAGRRALFIRLNGCNLQCPGCDTEYTSKRYVMTPANIVYEVRNVWHPVELIVITGGEPFRQNITPAVMSLLEFGYTVQIETNGVLSLPDFPYEHASVVISPKTAKINKLAAEKAAAFKYVIQAGSVAEDGLPTVALGHIRGVGRGSVARPPSSWAGPIYVQPMDEKDEAKNAANVRACVESVMKNGKLTLGFQMHKEVNLP